MQPASLENWWISAAFATGQVNTQDGIIVMAPPIWRKFEGQPLKNLVRWLFVCEVRKLGD